MQRRIASIGAEQHHTGASAVRCQQRADRFLSPLPIDEASSDALGPAASTAGFRCSDKGFLPMPLDEYLRLLDWTARQRADGKRGFTPEQAPPILQRLGLSADTWCELVENFGRLFHNVADCPAVVARCAACGRSVATVCPAAPATCSKRHSGKSCLF